MGATQKRIGRNVENEILRCIVDAMLAAETELSQAKDDQWQRILVDSCRQQKLRPHSTDAPPATSC